MKQQTNFSGSMLSQNALVPDNAATAVVVMNAKQETNTERESKSRDMNLVVLQYFSLSFMGRLGVTQFKQLKKCIGRNKE